MGLMALSELRQTLRRLARQPGFTAAAVLSLALGIGATVAMFSIVNGVLLQPLTYREPGQLYLAQMIPPPQFKIKGTWPVNARHFHEWRQGCQSCDSVALVDGFGFSLTGKGEPERLPGLRLSYNFFSTLGVKPALGRDFRREEELPGHFGEVILTDAFWRSHFNANPKILGQQITLNGETHEIVGVMPASLQLPKGNEWRVGFPNPLPPVLFRPFGMDFAKQDSRGSFNYVAVIRLKPGAKPEKTATELDSLIAPLVKMFGAILRTEMVPMRDQVTGGSRPALLLLLGAVGTLMLMVCLNVGNLMLLRTTGRYREAGIRTALGSNRLRLFGLVFQEAAVLVTIGAAFGLAVANTGLRLFQWMAPVNLPRLDEVRLDSRVLLFAVIASALCAVLCGLFPAWRLTRTAPLTSLKAGSLNATESRAKFRLREALVSIEVGLSALLLIVGALFTVSFYRVMQADRGIETAHVITQDMALIHPKYAGGKRPPFLADLVTRLRAIPQVEAAGFTTQLPLRGEGWTDDLADGSLPRSNDNANLKLAQFRFVSAGLAEALGFKLVSGRFVTPADAGKPVAMLSESAARMLWPNESAVGHFVWNTGRDAKGVATVLEVIGVVGEVRADAEAAGGPIAYVPYSNTASAGVTFALRTRGNPDSVMRTARNIIRAMDPDLPIATTRTMDQILEEATAVRRFETKLVGAFAIAALLLAVIGVYGVLAFSVARRTPEMGIRLALGSPAELIVAMIVRQGMTPVLIGLAAGVASALALGRVLASQLYEVTPRDPFAIAAVVAALLFAGLAASYLPARRASRTDPLQALRFE